MTIGPASDRSLFVSFGEEISWEAHQQVKRTVRCLQGVRGILNLHPAYSSVLVDFDPHLYDHARAGAIVMPASPGFYHRPKQVAELVDFVVARMLDHLGIEQSLVTRWEGNS